MRARAHVSTSSFFIVRNCVCVYIIYIIHFSLCMCRCDRKPGGALWKNVAGLCVRVYIIHFSLCMCRCDRKPGGALWRNVAGTGGGGTTRWSCLCCAGRLSLH